MSKILDNIEMTLVYDRYLDHDSNVFYGPASLNLVELTYGMSIWIMDMEGYEYHIQ